MFQTSVRPVRVGFLPMVFKASGLAPKSNTAAETATRATIKRVTTMGFRRTQRKLVSTISMLPIRKQDNEVMASAMRKIQSTITRMTRLGDQAASPTGDLAVPV